jgi:hypothetical protein
MYPRPNACIGKIQIIEYKLLSVKNTQIMHLVYVRGQATQKQSIKLQKLH